MMNVCIVGYGTIAPAHSKAIENSLNAQLVSVCDNNLKKLKNLNLANGLTYYDDYDKMLLDKNIDSVHICTPHYLHFEMIKKALAAGKKVVCEKPLTTTREDFDKLLALKGAETVCVVMQNRLNPCTIKLKEICKSGIIGKPLSAIATVTWCRNKDYYADSMWRGKIDKEGGGVLINQAIHTLDYFSYCLGDVDTTCGMVNNFSLKDVIEVEDTACAYLKFKDEITGVFFATNCAKENIFPKFEVQFENGNVRYENLKLYLDGQVIEYDEENICGKRYWGTGHDRLISELYDNNKWFSPLDVKNTMDTLFSIYESAKLGGKEVCLR